MHGKFRPRTGRPDAGKTVPFHAGCGSIRENDNVLFRNEQGVFDIELIVAFELDVFQALLTGPFRQFHNEPVSQAIVLPPRVSIGIDQDAREFLLPFHLVF